MFPPSSKYAGAARKGVTLLELLTALAIMVMVVGALGAITRAVQLGFEHNQGYGEATQHARVVLERITRVAREATANEKFPGLVVLAEEVGGWRFPDTLVIWHPSGSPASPDGLPRLNELVIYCPHPDDPGTLVEIIPGQSGELSADKAAWAAQIVAVKRSPQSQVTALSSLLRTSSVASNVQGELRGAVRFEVRLRPSEAQWQDTSIAWSDLPWVQGIYSPQTGLRQAWVRIEIQLLAGEPPAAGRPKQREVLPFFGSAAVYYTMRAERRP